MIYQVTVLPHPRVSGWNGPVEELAEIDPYPTVDLLDALTTHYPTDAHLVTHHVEHAQTGHRARRR